MVHTAAFYSPSHLRFTSEGVKHKAKADVIKLKCQDSYLFIEGCIQFVILALQQMNFFIEFGFKHSCF